MIPCYGGGKHESRRQHWPPFGSSGSRSGTQILAGPIYNMEQVYQDPQVQARDMLVDLEDPELGTLHNIGIPVKLSKTPGRIRHRAPALGEHSMEILK